MRLAISRNACYPFQGMQSRGVVGDGRRVTAMRELCEEGYASCVADGVSCVEGCVRVWMRMMITWHRWRVSLPFTPSPRTSLSPELRGFTFTLLASDCGLEQIPHARGALLFGSHKHTCQPFLSLTYTPSGRSKACTRVRGRERGELEGYKGQGRREQREREREEEGKRRDVREREFNVAGTTPLRR
eukprot:3662140-Rhodomonas_salina.1